MRCGKRFSYVESVSVELGSRVNRPLGKFGKLFPALKFVGKVGWMKCSRGILEFQAEFEVSKRKKCFVRMIFRILYTGCDGNTNLNGGSSLRNNEVRHIRENSIPIYIEIMTNLINLYRVPENDEQSI